LADREIVMQAPHLVVAVREELERLYGAEMLYKGGLQVYTTLDLEQQRLAEQVARERIASLRERGASNAALMVLDPYNGDVLALLGSVDFHDATIGGQVDVTRRLRQPGSTIKPLTYLAALERGWTPGTLLMDVAQDFPDGANPPYRPHNYDGEEWGPISLRTALACSRNIPAVSTLYQIGLPALIEMGQRLGIASLNRPDYGLSLTLGGGDITLWELTAAYGALANGGLRVTPRTILYIEDQNGHVLQGEQDAPMPRVLDARHAYLITDILADRETRQRAFGAQSPLEWVIPPTSSWACG
jgi:membrane carboxypeptidase/penicillin-binding protein